LSMLLSILLNHVASLFILSGVVKVFSYKEFIEATINFRVIPYKAAIIAGGAVPLLEMAGGLFLLSMVTRSYGIILLTLLLLAFFYSVWKVLKEGRTVSCSCYGGLLDAKADRFTLGKIVYLLVVLAMLFVNEQTELTAASAITGIILTIIFFIVQKLWQTYSQTMERLRK